MQGFLILAIIGTEKKYFTHREILTKPVEREM